MMLRIRDLLSIDEDTLTSSYKAVSVLSLV